MGKRRWEYFMILLPVFTALLCLLFAVFRPGLIVPAQLAHPKQQIFTGRYSMDGDVWQDFDNDTEFSSRNGDLVLQGRFTDDIPKGTLLNYFRDHIGVAIYINGQLWSMDIVSEIDHLGMELSPSICGREWDMLVSPGITAEDEIEIHLHNPHRFGNEDAYNLFLETLCSGGSENNLAFLQELLKPMGEPFRIAAVFSMVVSLLLIGASVAAALLRASSAGKLLNLGLLALFAGCFAAFDTIDVSFWSEHVAWNTHIRQLSMMMFVYCLCFYIFGLLSGRKRKIVGTAMLISMLLNILLFVFAMCGLTLIYETGALWGISQLVLLPVLVVCCAVELRTMKSGHRRLSIISMLMCAAVLADLIGVGRSIFSHAACSIVVFLLFAVIHIFEASKEIIRNYQASVLAERWKKEAENSRTAIMLSQIKPHFLHNSLGVIQELCHTEPLAAEDAIGNFAQYLRGNMGALESDQLIPFKKELEHAKCYLEIEKLRFGDQLKVLIYAKEVRFKLPALTIQPLVENAVRHGARKREDGGTVTLSTEEYPDHYEVCIQDDGPGFDPDCPPDDDKLHVGIANVRERLQRMCRGELQIESTPGVGTKVTIILPKEVDEC